MRATRAGCEVLVARFTADADRLLPAPGGPDLLAAVAAAEPQPVALVGPDGVAELCRALAVVVDLEGATCSATPRTSRRWPTGRVSWPGTPAAG